MATELEHDARRTFAGWCAVDLVHAGGTRRLRFTHADPAKAALCKELQEYPLDRSRPSLVSEALETRQPVLMSEVPPGFLESVAQGAEHLRRLRELDPRSLIVIPLIARGHLLVTVPVAPSARE